MRRAALLVTLLTTVTASAAWAAYSAMPMDDLTHPEPGSPNQEIVIKVAADDLSRCIATLANVLQPPVDPDQITQTLSHTAQAPAVRCAVE